MNISRSVREKPDTPVISRAFEGPDREVSLKELLRILQRQLNFILCVVIFLLAPVVIHALRLTPMYTAVASVVVEPRPQLLLLADGSPAAQPPDPAYLETLSSAIQSRSFTSRTMEELDLFADPEFFPVPEAAVGRIRYWANSIVGGGFPSESPVSVKTSDVDRLETMATFDDGLEVSPQSQSYVIKISFTSIDPNKAALIANSVAQQFIDMQLAEKSATVQRAIRGVAGRLDAAQQALLQAERELSEIRQESNFIPGQPMPLSHMQAEETARALMQTLASYAMASAKLEVIESIRASGGRFEDLEEVIASPVVGRLRIQIADIQARVREAAAAFGENHPRTRAVQTELETASKKMFEEIDRIVGALRNEATIIAAQMRELEKQLALARERSVLDNEATARLESAEGDVAVKRSLYEALLRRQEETAVQESWLTPDVRLISEAAPPLEPSTPSPTVLIGAGSTVSLVLALFLALLREQTDTSLRSDRQVERELGVSCLGVVPKVVSSREGPSLLVMQDPESSYAQSVGAVWAQLRIAAPKAQMLLVTSALPREGKGSLARSLAYCARQSDGMRTALVDFHLWGSRAEATATSDVAPGVADIPGQVRDQRLSLDDIVKVNPETGVDVFPFDPRAHGSTAMTSEQSLAALCGELRQRYDIVFIDAPPLLGVGDARRLAYFADASLLVVRWGATSIEAASSALQILTRASDHVVGAVLTQVNSRRQSLYGSGDSVQYSRTIRRYYSNRAR